jgi:hypothetical protein
MRFRFAVPLCLVLAAGALHADRKASANAAKDSAIEASKAAAAKKAAEAEKAVPAAAKPASETKPTPPAPVAAIGGDIILRSMKDEMDRSRELAIASLDVPYYIEYELDDAQQFSVSASLGGLLNSTQNRFRIPRVRVRVGDYNFDNNNYIFSNFYSGSRYDSERMPIEDDLSALRHEWWLGTDRAYKAAVEAIARKRAALKNITQSEELPDLWKMTPTTKLVPIPKENIDTAKWTARVRQWSSLFNRYPEALSSQVSFDALQSTHYAHTSEGTTLRLPDVVYSLNARVYGQAPDGMTVRDSLFLHATSLDAFPSENDVEKATLRLGENLKALSAAPVAESYSGPVLFAGPAAAQVFAEVFGFNLAMTRRPVSEPGRNVPFTQSELEGRVGSRVLPEFLTVVDDPSQTRYKGTPLIGHYQVDEEGVEAKPLTLVNKGKLETMLLTRQPVKGFQASNGRARLPGPYGARMATFSNLFVQASDTVSESDLKAKLIEMIKQRNKPYGMLIRKMDFPSTATIDELRSIASRMGQGGGRAVSSPLLAYRVYPDGREELVRGLRLRGFNTRSFRDITAASSETYVFHVMNNLAPLGLVGGASYVAAQSIVAPSLLFEDVELDRPQESMPKLPTVPPPPLAASR